MIFICSVVIMFLKVLTVHGSDFRAENQHSQWLFGGNKAVTIVIL